MSMIQYANNLFSTVEQPETFPEMVLSGAPKLNDLVMKK